MPENDALKQQLSGILEDPEAMARIMSIAGSLMGGMNPSDDSPEAQADSGSNDTAPAKEAQGSVNSPTDGFDLSAALPAIAGILKNDKKNDPRTNLLYALKPYMSHDRGEKIDMLVKAMKLADIAGGFISGGGS